MNRRQTFANLIVVRHGQTAWNVERRCQGQSGEGLNQTGIGQAEAAGHEIKSLGLEVEAVYSSDLQRTLETAEIIARIIDVPVRTDARLRELHQGAWEGRLYPEFETEYLRFVEDPSRHSPPGGETLVALARRVVACFSDIAARHANGRVVIVSHELPIAISACAVAKRPLHEWPQFAPENGKLLLWEWPLATQPVIEFVTLGQHEREPDVAAALRSARRRSRARRRLLRRYARKMRLCALLSLLGSE